MATLLLEQNTIPEIDEQSILDRFGFMEPPFHTHEDLRWHYLTPTLKETLAETVMGIKSKEGLMTLIGPYGSGKSMAVRRLAAFFENKPEYQVRILTNPATATTGLQILKETCASFGVDRVRQRDVQFELFRRFVMESYEQGVHPVLIIDEAQNLTDTKHGALPMLKALNNFSNVDHRSLSILLVAQEALRKKLDKHPEITSRIETHGNLTTLSRDDMRDMFLFRMMVAGLATPEGLFTDEALDLIYQASGGVPRDAVILAKGSLYHAHIQDRYRVTGDVARKAIDNRQIGGGDA